MSMKYFMEDCFEKLSSLTGYSWCQLDDLYLEQSEDEDFSWYSFVTTTLELDWDEAPEPVRAAEHVKNLRSHVVEYVRFDPFYAQEVKRIMDAGETFFGMNAIPAGVAC